VNCPFLNKINKDYVKKVIQDTPNGIICRKKAINRLLTLENIITDIYITNNIDKL
jgi:hypothetical protein